MINNKTIIYITNLYSKNIEIICKNKPVKSYHKHHEQYLNERKSKLTMQEKKGYS